MDSFFLFEGISRNVLGWTFKHSLNLFKHEIKLLEPSEVPSRREFIKRIGLYAICEGRYLFFCYGGT